MPRVYFTQRELGLLAQAIQRWAEPLEDDDAAVTLLLELSCINVEIHSALKRSLELDRQARFEEPHA